MTNSSMNRAQPIESKKPKATPGRVMKPTVPEHPVLLYPPYKRYGASFYRSDGGDSNVIPLDLFVSSEMDPPAKLILNHDFQGALAMLEHPTVTHGQAQSELHYLRGLCFQSLSRFDSSRVEYETASKLTNDPILRGKSEIGIAQSVSKKTELEADQVLFPKDVLPRHDSPWTRHR